jgi:hypothetical protein
MSPANRVSNIHAIAPAGSSRSTPALKAFIVEDTLAPPSTTAR